MLGKRAEGWLRPSLRELIVGWNAAVGGLRPAYRIRRWEGLGTPEGDVLLFPDEAPPGTLLWGRLGGPERFDGGLWAAVLVWPEPNGLEAVVAAAAFLRALAPRASHPAVPALLRALGYPRPDRPRAVVLPGVTLRAAPVGGATWALSAAYRAWEKLHFVI
ncbi:MAG: hypothetical protein HSCHL_2331 [Hydrogenibacillus schlegelii]|uniref:Uncharacterized protein n=1 Tax=Hydrogenibacillus schlegelii TaxID=1484 RepID=A0A2T5GEY2_HYDSH|nr:hypothetical protein [Hydrogenibacillus schlegelii]PTQ54740.1 MAG: hypothetical protein HSCHL_2331 [Hydrogenibacillus schlegelii]